MRIGLGGRSGIDPFVRSKTGALEPDQSQAPNVVAPSLPEPLAVYVPAHFNEDRVEALHALIRSTGLATLVSMTEGGLIASHAPLLLDPDPAPYGTLIGHLAKPNPHVRAADPGVQTLVIFQGPDGYITPSYYAAKQEHGKVVPTWNYTSVHAYGTLEAFDDPARLLDIVTRLTERHEAARTQPWAVADAPADFVRGMLRGIVGIALPIARLEGKVKMSQNRPASDIAGVVAGLRHDGRDDLARAVAGATGG
jgi:transcriptional regulator